MSLSVILTCYNETPSIFDSYEKIVSFMDLTKIEYEIIIVDDGSLPDVQKQLSNYFHEKNNTILLFSNANEGRGAAVTKGIRVSSKDYVGFIDTDLEIPESSLFNLYYGITRDDSFDVVIGKRVYLLGCNLYHWLRAIYSRLYFLLANVFLNIHFLDTETGVKLFRRDKILPVLDSVRDKRWFWDTEIIAQSLKHNLKITQLPVFLLRKKQRSSVAFLRDTRRYLYGIYKYLRR
ncbi:MAG: glycosyltransferase, partial [Candidatus Omnitrophota bacterium]